MASKKTDALVTKLRRGGAVVERRGMRYRVTQPGKEMCFLPVVDPKEQKALDNKVADLRRKGYGV